MLPRILVSEINTDNESITREIVEIPEFPDIDSNENIINAVFSNAATTSASASLEDYFIEDSDEDGGTAPSSSCHHPQVYIFFSFGDEGEGFWSDDESENKLEFGTPPDEISIDEEFSRKLLSSQIEPEIIINEELSRKLTTTQIEPEIIIDEELSRKLLRTQIEPTKHFEISSEKKQLYNHTSSTKSHPISHRSSYQTFHLTEKHEQSSTLSPVKLSRFSQHGASELFDFPPHIKNNRSKQGFRKKASEKRLIHNIRAPPIASDLRQRWTHKIVKMDPSYDNRSSLTSFLSTTVGVRLGRKLFPTGFLKGAVTIFHRKAEKYWKSFYRPYRGIYFSSDTDSIFKDQNIHKPSIAKSDSE